MGESTKVNKVKKEGKENGGNNSNKLIVILLIITIVVVVGLATFFGYMMLIKKSSGSNNQTTVTKEAVKTVDLDEFIVNLAGTGNNYVKVTISLGYVNGDVATEITDSKSIVRDAINKTIMGKKASEFKETGGIDKIQNQLKTSINSVLTKGQITNVYFSNIVIQ